MANGLGRNACETFWCEVNIGVEKVSLLGCLFAPKVAKLIYTDGSFCGCSDPIDLKGEGERRRGRGIPRQTKG